MQTPNMPIEVLEAMSGATAKCPNGLLTYAQPLRFVTDVASGRRFFLPMPFGAEGRSMSSGHGLKVEIEAPIDREFVSLRRAVVYSSNSPERFVALWEIKTAIVPSLVNGRCLVVCRKGAFAEGGLMVAWKRELASIMAGKNHAKQMATIKTARSRLPPPEIVLAAAGITVIRLGDAGGVILCADPADMKI